MTESRDILLVEDNAYDIELAVIALLKGVCGRAHEIVTCRDGEVALDYLCRRGSYHDRHSGHPAVVLLDLKLPRVDGFEVLQRIKTNTDLSTVPVVVLTSSREPSDIRRSYDFGANAYVVKPMSFDDYMDVVCRVGYFWTTVNVPPVVPALSLQPC